MYFTTSVDVCDYLFNEYNQVLYILNEFRNVSPCKIIVKNKFVFLIPELCLTA